MGASILQAMVSIFVLTLSLRMKFYFFVQSYKISPVTIALWPRDFGLVSSIHLERGKPKIYIKARSLNPFRSLVRPYFHKFMVYKLEKPS